MHKYTLIQAIYHQVPATYRGLNKNGEHVVQIPKGKDTPAYATLERLPITQLQRIADTLKIISHSAHHTMH